jgi:DNA-directed RNA polymerase alpha subunit
MASTKKTVRTCRKGHQYYKSTDCSTCPICEAEKKPADGFLASMSAPARRALEHAGIATEKELSAWTEKELLKLHGFGPASLPKLRAALKVKGLSFKKD